jgi:hypothetical protein
MKVTGQLTLRDWDTNMTGSDWLKPRLVLDVVTKGKVSPRSKIWFYTLRHLENYHEIVCYSWLLLVLMTFSYRFISRWFCSQCFEPVAQSGYGIEDRGSIPGKDGIFFFFFFFFFLVIASRPALEPSQPRIQLVRREGSFPRGKDGRA